MNKSSFTKQPFFKSEKDFGYFKLNSNLKSYYVVEDLYNTSIAMQRVPKQEIKDENNLKTTNEDDFTTSLKELLNALDTFIGEKNNKRKVELKDFNLEKPHELTIYLLWQIRHMLTHTGGIIDLKGKTQYEKIFQDAKSKENSPSLDLPEILSLGEQFVIDHTNYTHVKQCILEYLKSRLLFQEYILW